jgi:hypothetical protein
MWIFAGLCLFLNGKGRISGEEIRAVGKPIACPDEKTFCKAGKICF